MKKNDVTPISSAMKNVEQYHTDPNFRQFEKRDIVINPIVFTRLEEFSIKQKWKSVVGPMFANAAQSLSVRNRVLYVSVSSPAIRNELILNKSVIVQRVNEEMKKKALVDMVVR